MAKWIRRLTTNQEIPGSTPGELDPMDPMHHIEQKFLQIFCKLCTIYITIYL
jgi:hypothetical protein